MTNPCIKCGSLDRRPNGDCRPCAIARDRLYKSQRREQLAAYSRAYHASHIDECHERNKKWRTENPEAKKAMDAEYKRLNHDKVVMYKKKHYELNATKIKKRSVDWANDNREHVRERERVRHQQHPELRVNAKAKRRERIGNDRLPYGTVPALMKSQNGLCACCGQPLIKYHVDHIMPLALGGRNIVENVQLLLPRCNHKKYAKHPDIWKAEKGLI